MTEHNTNQPEFEDIKESINRAFEIAEQSYVGDNGWFGWRKKMREITHNQNNATPIQSEDNNSLSDNPIF